MHGGSRGRRTRSRIAYVARRGSRESMTGDRPMTDVRNPARPVGASLVAAAIVSGLLGLFAVGARGRYHFGRNGLHAALPAVQCLGVRIPQDASGGEDHHRFHRFGRGHRASDFGRGADRSFRRLHVGCANQSAPSDHQCRDGDLGANRQLQLARPRGRESETRRADARRHLHGQNPGLGR